MAIYVERQEQRQENEYRALLSYLQTLDYIAVQEIGPEFSQTEHFILKNSDLLWVYKNDTMATAPKQAREIRKYLTRYLEAGGSVLLANQAAIFLSSLGLENDVPQTRLKKSRDEGYGRQLGYHAYLSHPVFNGLNGGAYVMKPLKDTMVLQTGYFDGQFPSGRTIAVDWDYIFLREDSKLIMEYTQGKGKVIAVGAYLLFDPPNRNRLHLERFTENLIRYLAGTELPDNSWYWNFRPGKVIEQPLHISPSIQTNNKEPGTLEPWTSGTLEPWNPETPEPVIIASQSSGNYWDLAGERMLAMGIDQGGITEIWAHPTLCLRDYRITYSLLEAQKNAGHNSYRELSGLQPGIVITPGSYIRSYRMDDEAGIVERTVISPMDPVGVIHYHYTGNESVELEISFRMLFRLMWPYSEKVTGDLIISWDEELCAFLSRDASGELVTLAGVRAGRGTVPVRHTWAQDSAFSMPVAWASIRLILEEAGDLYFILASSAEGMAQTRKYYLEAFNDPSRVFRQAEQHARSVLERSVSITTPDSNFNRAFQWARLATDRFMVYTPATGASLTAGYATSDHGWDGEHAVSGRPGYGWYFGRDGAWSAFALLQCGDFENVKRILETFQRYQDLNGKIFHELSTSGIVHYDAADATPLYVILAGRYLRHSGDTAFIRRSWPHISKAMDYCYSTDTDDDFLIENTNVGHGWVEGGHLFGSHTSLHLASCWAEALDEAAYIAGSLDLNYEQDIFRSRARRISDIINTEFWNDQSAYYYHGLMPDGSFMENISIMPVIPMLFGQADADKASKVMPAIATNAFTSDWGCRIVPRNDPRFNPRGYHTGSVWPLFTGWASLAEFRYHNYLQAFAHLSANHQLWKYWGLGFSEEVLHGEVFQPAGVCHHQCWSETMSLQPVIEGMLGSRPDALHNRIDLSPWFPADWDSVSVQGIRVGDDRIEMAVYREKGKGLSEGGDDGPTVYQLGKDSATGIHVHLSPVLPPGCTVKDIRVNDVPQRAWALNITPQGWVIPSFRFLLDSAVKVEIHWLGGITALPAVSSPQPGEPSSDFRIIDTKYNDGTYTLTLQAPRASRQEFRVWAAEPGIWKTADASIINIAGNIITYETTFPDVESDHAIKTVSFQKADQ